jgi:hypothetical protein
LKKITGLEEVQAVKAAKNSAGGPKRRAGTLRNGMMMKTVSPDRAD